MSSPIKDPLVYRYLVYQDTMKAMYIKYQIVKKKLGIKIGVTQLKTQNTQILKNAWVLTQLIQKVICSSAYTTTLYIINV